MKATLTRSTLHRLGYRRGKPTEIGRRFYFKRRLTRGGSSAVTIHLQAFSETSVSGGGKRGAAESFHVNSTECKVTADGISAGPDHSTVSTGRQLREWERFAFVP